MANPPYHRMEAEAQAWFKKPLEECTEDERRLCEDMAWEYCGCSPEEAAEAEYYRKNGRYIDDE